MRRAQKVQIEGFVKLLGEAHSEMKKGLKKRVFENVLPLLEKCQQETIQLGKLIEDTEGEGHKTVAVLEEYCELLYLLYEEIMHGNYADSMKLYKKLRYTLIQIENSVKYDISIRREIVFFPYKASMWDSLESVWRAAAREEECDVYVVPIPYFDKNPDGSLGKMHYEGGQYPEDVPVVSWLKYHLEDRRPDIIFIHNPYDECNLVTSVHPDYYAPELKKYTDMLVYISYFVAVGDKMESHFCRNPGIYLADKVIVQSEAVRDFYISELRQCETEYNCKGALGDIEGKILALGSPKFDKVMSAGREDKEVPEDWKPLLFHPDGGRKKAVLYNTTVDGMLKHSDKMLLKIKNVLRQFRDQGDSVLLWRPHPLLLTALEAMRPEMVQEYQDIVREYKSSKAGIYDDSADMYRAIAVSDAYYGDMSSVVELYKQTGKPILIQSADYDGYNGLVFQAFVQIDEYTAYASCALFNGLFKADLRTGNCAYIGMFQQEPEDGFRLHAKAVYTNEKIFFLPSTAAHIGVYCMETGRIEVIPMEGDGHKLSAASREITKCDFGRAESGYEIIPLFEAGQYVYFIKAKKGSIRRSPLIWNSYEHFRLNKADGSVGSFSFRFMEGREEFWADHQQYINHVSGNLSVGRENLVFDLQELLHKLSADGKSGNRMANVVSPKATVGEVICKTILELADREDR